MNSLNENEVHNDVSPIDELTLGPGFPTGPIGPGCPCGNENENKTCKNIIVYLLNVDLGCNDDKYAQETRLLFLF